MNTEFVDPSEFMTRMKPDPFIAGLSTLELVERIRWEEQNNGTTNWSSSAPESCFQRAKVVELGKRIYARLDPERNDWEDGLAVWLPWIAGYEDCECFLSYFLGFTDAQWAELEKFVAE